MKHFRRLASIAFLSACTALAIAEPLDYRTNVLDPPPPVGSSYPTFIILTTPFDFSYTTCVANELPNGLQADGCFAGVNRTGSDWIGIQFTFPNDNVLAGQPASCAPAQSDNIYSDTNCSLDPDGSGYTLSFTDGVIHNGDFFFITETGVVPAESFPQGHATVTTSSTTPEPAPLLLSSTGLFLAALFAWRMRKKPFLFAPRF